MNRYTLHETNYVCNGRLGHNIKLGLSTSKQKAETPYNLLYSPLLLLLQQIFDFVHVDQN